jgi:hypothetical protein
MSDEEEKDFIDELEEELTASAPVVGEKVAEEVTAPPYRSPPPPMITFDRYFMALGKPMHHKAGMAAYGSIKGKKTKEAWDSLFKKY